MTMLLWLSGDETLPDPDPEPPAPNPDPVRWPGRRRGYVEWWIVEYVEGAWVRRSPLDSAVPSVIPEVLNGIGTGTITYSLADPSARFLVGSRGQLATSVDSPYELQEWRNGQMVRWMVITDHKADIPEGKGTLTVSTSEQLLSWRLLGGGSLKNWADVDAWTPMADRAGKFAAGLPGWDPVNCNAISVTSPSKDSGAPYSAKVWPDFGPGVDQPGIGLVRRVEVQHSFPGGLDYRLTAWNWMPSGGTGSGFWYGAAMRLRLWPPGATVWDIDDPDSVEAVATVETTHPRGKWVQLYCTVKVPPSDPGDPYVLEMILAPGEFMSTYWSRFAIVRDDVFTARNYFRGDFVSGAVARLIDEMSYDSDGLPFDGDRPYRGLIASGATLDEPTSTVPDGTPPPAGLQRIRYSYHQVEHRNVWDTALEMARNGNCDVWVEAGSHTRVLRCGARGRKVYEYPVSVDGMRGRVLSWAPSAGKARSRMIVQSPTSDWHRPEGVGFGSAMEDGAAMVDEVTTATAGSEAANLYELAQQRITARSSAPQIMQVVLDGDAVHTVHAGDWLRVDARAGLAHVESTTTRWWRITSMGYDAVTDTCPCEITDMALPDG